MEKEKRQQIIKSLCSLIYIMLTSTLSENLYIQGYELTAPLDQNSTFWISASALGFYIGVKLFKHLRSKVFILPIIMHLLIFILNFVAFILLYLPRLFIYYDSNSEENLLYFVFTLSKVIFGISQIMNLLELILIQKQKYKNDEETKRWLFFCYPLAQLLGLAFTIQIVDYLGAIYCFIALLTLNLLLICFQSIYQLKHYSRQFQYIITQKEIQQNFDCLSENSEIKFMKILILLFISTTQDKTYILPFLSIPLVIFINLIHIFFHKRINVKLSLIVGQAIVIIGLIFYIFSDAIGIFLVSNGNQVGIGSSQYYIIQKQLSLTQIIDYFETYSILLLLLVSLNSSYISNLIRFYMSNIGLKLIVTITMTVLMIIILKKSKIDGVSTKDQEKNKEETEKEKEKDKLIQV